MVSLKWHAIILYYSKKREIICASLICIPVLSITTFKKYMFHILNQTLCILKSVNT